MVLGWHRARYFKENWFSGSGSGGSDTGLLKEVIHLIAQYFSAHGMGGS